MPSEDESKAGSAPLYLSEEKQVFVTPPSCLSVSLWTSAMKKMKNR